MPQVEQNKCFAVWVLKLYVVSASAPATSLKRSAGTMRCRNPTLLQIEQLHSSTCNCAGATTSNRTRPQWQPPLCVIIQATLLRACHSAPRLDSGLTAADR